MKQVPLPLFHGTSSLMLESIKEHGLGGKNPLDSLKVYDLFQEFYKKICNEGFETEFSYDYINVEKACFQQRGGSNRINYQHGSVYLTVYGHQAWTYAKSHYKYGCEALFFVNELKLFIEEKKLWDEQYNDRPAIKWLDEAAKQEPKPVVLVIRKNILCLENVSRDNGDSVNENNLEGIKHFRLQNPIPFENLIEIDQSGNQVVINYET